MTINISEIKYEETFVGLYGDFTHYFIAPKELVKNSHPDCEHATISVESDGCGDKSVKDCTIYEPPKGE